MQKETSDERSSTFAIPPEIQEPEHATESGATFSATATEE
jgi:hypothetical protein